MARFSSTQQQPPRDTLYWKVFSLDLTIMERKSISEIKKTKLPFYGKKPPTEPGSRRWSHLLQPVGATAGHKYTGEPKKHRMQTTKY